MRVLKKPLFWIAFVILINLVLAFIIFKPAILPTTRRQEVNKTPKNNITKSKPGSCKFLVEKYCGEGHVEDASINGKQYKVIGFSVPQGTEIMTPFDAEAQAGTLTNFQWKGNVVVLQSKEDKSESVSLFGDLKFNQNQSWKFSKGESVATITGEDVTNIKNYNLLILIAKKTGNKGLETDTKMIHAYFSNL